MGGEAVFQILLFSSLDTSSPFTSKRKDYKKEGLIRLKMHQFGNDSTRVWSGTCVAYTVYVNRISRLSVNNNACCLILKTNKTRLKCP